MLRLSPSCKPTCEVFLLTVCRLSWVKRSDNRAVFDMVESEFGSPVNFRAKTYGCWMCDENPAMRLRDVAEQGHSQHVHPFKFKVELFSADVCAMKKGNLKRHQGKATPRS
jgi:hypothetical protein